MNYESELRFAVKLFRKFRLNVRTFRPSADMALVADVSLEHLLEPSPDYQKIYQTISGICRPARIYRLLDAVRCSYFLLQLPETEEPAYLLIGPYRLAALSPEEFQEKAQAASAPASLHSRLQKIYEELPLLPDEGPLLSVVYTLGEVLWGGEDHFTMQTLENFHLMDFIPKTEDPESLKQEENQFNMKLLEERYASENRLIQAVSQGQSHKAEILISNFTALQMEQRVSSPLRSMKNYTIILNTLLRKAAEAGAVHPLHIDSLSARFARKIELAASTRAIDALQKEMVHKYCLLVKNHSLKGYSLLIRKVITQIDADLTADLSLRAQAELLNVNSSYLSTLFKKETGSTLTEYVNRKRIEYAIFLLNTSSLQIQTIAQYCGIPDVNYFAKTFKKHIGKTPKEYRDGVMAYNRPQE